MNRTAVGLTAIGFLVCGAALYVWPQNWESYPLVLSACVRVGAVLGAIWLAHPQLNRMPDWLFALGVAAMLLAAIRPKVILIAIPILILIALLRPRSKL